MELNEVKKELEDAGLKEIIYGSPQVLRRDRSKAHGYGIHSFHGERGPQPGAAGEFPAFCIPHYSDGGIHHSQPFVPKQAGRICGHARPGDRKTLLQPAVLTLSTSCRQRQGALIGAAAGMISGAVDPVSGVIVWGLYLIFYMMGAGAAMWRFGRFSIAAVLSHRD